MAVDSAVGSKAKRQRRQLPPGELIREAAAKVATAVKHRVPKEVVVAVKKAKTAKPIPGEKISGSSHCVKSWREPFLTQHFSPAFPSIFEAAVTYTFAVSSFVVNFCVAIAQA